MVGGGFGLFFPASSASGEVEDLGAGWWGWCWVPFGSSCCY